MVLFFFLLLNLSMMTIYGKVQTRTKKKIPHKKWLKLKKNIRKIIRNICPIVHLDFSSFEVAKKKIIRKLHTNEIYIHRFCFFFGFWMSTAVLFCIYSLWFHLDSLIFETSINVLMQFVSTFAMRFNKKKRHIWYENNAREIRLIYSLRWNRKRIWIDSLLYGSTG